MDWLDREPCHPRGGSEAILRIGTSFFTPESVASRGNGHALLHGIKVGFLFEFVPEFLTAGFEEFDVRFAVGFHLSPRDEMVVGSDLLSIPSFKFGFLFEGHAVGVIVGHVWHGSLVVLIF